jgi:hypothetical protein
MALDNLITVVLTDEKVSKIDTAMSEIENIIKNKAVDLTPKHRQTYGSVAYEPEVWVDKAFDYMQQDPKLVPPYINMEEHTADIVAHRALNPRVEWLKSILQSLEDTNRLLDGDLYNNFLTYCRSLREAVKV